MISAHAFAGSTPLSVKILRLTFPAFNAAAYATLQPAQFAGMFAKDFGIVMRRVWATKRALKNTYFQHPASAT